MTRPEHKDTVSFKKVNCLWYSKFYIFFIHRASHLFLLSLLLSFISHPSEFPQILPLKALDLNPKGKVYVKMFILVSLHQGFEAERHVHTQNRIHVNSEDNWLTSHFLREASSCNVIVLADFCPRGRRHATAFPCTQFPFSLSLWHPFSLICLSLLLSVGEDSHLLLRLTEQRWDDRLGFTVFPFLPNVPHHQVDNYSGFSFTPTSSPLSRRATS